MVHKLKAQWLSGLNLRLNEIEHKFEKFSQMSAYSLKAQWLSGIKLRLNEVRHKVDKFHRVIGH